ncbi:hypothetical protein BCR32DRAFT_248653 [Anaeromyces robustus]|uniref:Uncharacterized protein n=1 Tax=Anaeromyces robustus TaxID=1754192 RepID=A0A1Y1WSQ6_9FUNG|nr:hypothetical protein BCR32DRAFT_248653 [Anaeromyces robustus]|eukprot:ORX76557.1 hypothetical protein BCR32DRAFT_248653 [Anaeromyces robustus]
MYIYSLEIEDSLIYTYENITNFQKYENHIYISNTSRTFKKSEILKFHKSYYLSYLCKDDICTEVKREALRRFIEIPDKKGNKKLYICKTYLYDDIESHRYLNKKMTTIPCTPISNQENENKSYNKECQKNVIISLDCTSDSQCLSNKCIDNVCVFNEDSPIDFCTSVYKHIIFLVGYTYMHCGKMIGEPCQNNKECGSKNCLLGGYCGTTYGPSDTNAICQWISSLIKKII